MNSERTEAFSVTVTPDKVTPEHDSRQDSDKASGRDAGLAAVTSTQATRTTDQSSRDSGTAPTKGQSQADVKKSEEKSPVKEVSEKKVRMQGRLPALEDDTDTGVQKEQIVTRDGKADLRFTGELLASAAPNAASKGHWQEYRIYHTDGGKHVFSKVERTVFAEERDAYEAEVFDPSPSSMPSQLLRSARDLTRSKPLNWTDAAATFFGYDPLAKALYRKLDGQFEERID